MLKIFSPSGFFLVVLGIVATFSLRAQDEIPGNPDETITLVAETAYDTNFAEGEAYVVKSGDGTHEGLRCPVIIVEGFDPENKRNWIGLRKSLTVTPEAGRASFGLRLLRSGRDLILLNFAEGGGHIQDNGHVLTALLKHVKENRHDESEPVVVMGFSMGGLIGRYSLAWCEDRGVDHDVDLFISFDSPQEGASIPLGLQEALSWISESILFNFLDGSQQDAITDLIARQNCPAARQMTLCHYQTVENGQRAGADPLRLELETELETLGDYPTFPRKVGISNGSGFGEKLPFDAGDVLGAIIYEEGTTVLDLKVFAVSTTPVNVFTADLTFQVFGIPQHQTDVSTKYAEFAADGAPGGTSAFSGGDMFTESQDEVCFIPTVSSLGLPMNRLFENLSEDANLLADTPFDEISYAVHNEGHVEINERTQEVVVRNLFASMDLDGDGLSDQEEFDLGTYAWTDDTDGDGMDDAWEVRWQLDPNADDTGGDADWDGVSNGDEYQAGTCPRTEESLRWHDAEERLRAIGVAIQAYQAAQAQRGALPASLSELVTDGYLAADVLLNPNDPTTGDDPHPYDEDDFSAAYEEACSFFYLFSAAAHPDGGSWYDVSEAQRLGSELPDSAFPLVQCFYGLPAPAEGEAGRATVLNLAWDLNTVFATRGDWEAEPLPATDPELREDCDIACPLGATVMFPLWSPWREQPGQFRFTISGGRGAAVIDGRFLQVLLEDPEGDYDVVVNMLSGETVVAVSTYHVRVAHSWLSFQLEKGWNLLGFPMGISEDPLPFIEDETRESGSLDNCNFWDAWSSRYVATRPASAESPGFWVRADSRGDKVAEIMQFGDCEHELPAGWNLVGFPADILISASGALTACYQWNASLLCYEKLVAVDGFLTFRAGRGYWLYLTDPCRFDSVNGVLEAVEPAR